MTRRLLLDAFCCAGGATRGYQDAGFHVVGVDIVDQPDYCGDDFVRADAVKFIAEHGHKFHARSASPPCQANSSLTKGTNQGRVYPQLIPATRAALEAVGGPWVMENVAGAPLRRDLMLCGEMFDLAVIRHRFFEFGNWTMPQPQHRPHRGRVAGMRHGQWFTGPYFAVYGNGGGKGTVPQWQAAMDIDWTTNRHALAEAIPPAYTRLIGAHLLTHLDRHSVSIDLAKAA